jgi:hypothetical protein
MVSDPDPKQEMQSFNKYDLNAMKMPFIVAILKERIFRVGSETGFVTFY